MWAGCEWGGSGEASTTQSVCGALIRVCIIFATQKDKIQITHICLFIILGVLFMSLPVNLDSHRVNCQQIMHLSGQVFHTKFLGSEKSACAIDLENFQINCKDFCN